MKKALKVLVLAFPVILMLNCLCFAEDLTKKMDKFYAGLADIIERNMDNPEQCVREVDNYYAANQATIAQIRNETKKAMERVAPAMDEFEPIRKDGIEDVEEPQDMQKWAEDMQKLGEKMQRSRTATQTPGAERYAKAIQGFTMKYFQPGLKISTKAIQLIPNIDTMEKNR